SKEIVREWVVVSGHAIGGGHGPERAHVVVGARVAHDAHGTHWQKNRERLPDRIVEPGFADLLQVDRVGTPQNVKLLACNLSRHTNGEARTWKREIGRASCRERTKRYRIAG